MTALLRLVAALSKLGRRPRQAEAAREAERLARTEGAQQLTRTTTQLLDGIDTDLLDNEQLGEAVLLGDIREGLPRTAEWSMRWSSEGIKTFRAEARSDNASTASSVKFDADKFVSANVTPKKTSTGETAGKPFQSPVAPAEPLIGLRTKGGLWSL